MKIEVKNTSGKGVGSIDLDDAVFGAEVHEHLLWEAVKWQLAKRRAGTASTKRIGEVRGSAKKVWKQKGTGQARQGSRQAPHWVGGGSVFGPKPRSYEYQLPRKTKKAALRAALSLRASEQKLVVLDAFGTDGKTKSVATALAAIGASKKTLIVDAKSNELLVRGAKNLAKSQWLAPEGINVYDILRHETLVLTKDAADLVTKALKGKE
ncbi:MAG: 50S ribosomal protein L4 [Kofleriaceae bacterium]|nr:50S ribosomal protein L4 [Kofleriaceae bacterium]